MENSLKENSEKIAKFCPFNALKRNSAALMNTSEKVSRVLNISFHVFSSFKVIDEESCFLTLHLLWLSLKVRHFISTFL